MNLATKNIQSGVEQIIRGIYQAVRNPRSHERFDDSQQDADAIIIFINYLLSVIGHAKAAFSIDDVLSQISDENFVSNKRYCELILSDVPKPKLLDTAIAAFDARDIRSTARLKPFFQAIMERLEASDEPQFFAAISKNLRGSNDELELRSVFQILEAEQWPKIGEAERMRSENRVIRNISAGKYSQQSGKCLSGGMATWAVKFFSEFTLKREVLAELYRALSSSSRERQDYIFEYFFSSFPTLSDHPPTHFASHITKQLNRGDVRYKDAIDNFVFLDNENWQKPFSLAMSKFKKKEDAAPQEDFYDDDIPF